MTKGVQDVYTKNYKILPREIKEDLKERYTMFGIKRHNVAKISVPPNLICRHKAISIKIPVIVSKSTKCS